MDEISIRGRIAKVRRFFKWTENSLAPDPATQKRLNRQLSHDATITLDTLLLILDACPGLSADWLLLGRGEMLQGDSASSSLDFLHSTKGETTGIRNDSDIIHRFLSALEEKDRMIARLIDLLSKS